MTALAFSLTPQGIAIVKQGHEPTALEGANDVALVSHIQHKLTDDVSTLIACRGPGSFTSVRVVLSFAAGLRSSRPHLNFLSATTFELLAYESGYPSHAWMLVYSHQGYFYAQEWKGNKPVGEACRMNENDIPEQSFYISTPCPKPEGKMIISRPQALILMDMFEANLLSSSDHNPYYVHDPVFKTHTAR